MKNLRKKALAFILVASMTAVFAISASAGSVSGNCGGASTSGVTSMYSTYAVGTTNSSPAAQCSVTVYFQYGYGSEQRTESAWNANWAPSTSAQARASVSGYIVPLKAWSSHTVSYNGQTLSATSYS